LGKLKIAMTLSLRIRASQSRSWNSPMRLYFSVVVVPEITAKVGQDLVIVLDTSGSMNLVDIDVNQVDPSLIEGYGVVDGKEVVYLKDRVGARRIDIALEALRKVLEELDPSSRVTLITFSDSVRVICRGVSPSTSLEYLDHIGPEGNTSLYQAISTALELTTKNTSKVIIITDGYPTDVEDPRRYRSLKFPPFVQIVPIGVGEYNASILSALADITNGRYYHAESMSEVLEVLKTETTGPVAAKETVLKCESDLKVNLVNFQGFPVFLGSVEGVIKVFGYVEVPPNYSGKVLNLRVEYVDPVDGERKVEQGEITLSPARSQEDFRSGLNSSVVTEVNYYQKLREVLETLNSGDPVEVTRRVAELSQLAEKTKRTDLIEETKRLTRLNDLRSLSSEVTKRLRS